VSGMSAARVITNARAVCCLGSYAADVSSSVEASPSVKGRAKTRAFVRAVREWDLAQK